MGAVFCGNSTTDLYRLSQKWNYQFHWVVAAEGATALHFCACEPYNDNASTSIGSRPKNLEDPSMGLTFDPLPD